MSSAWVSGVSAHKHGLNKLPTHALCQGTTVQLAGKIHVLYQCTAVQLAKKLNVLYQGTTLVGP